MHRYLETGPFPTPVTTGSGQSMKARLNIGSDGSYAKIKVKMLKQLSLFKYEATPNTREKVVGL